MIQRRLKILLDQVHCWWSI